ncbi:hypothetical protein COHA_003894 [Chlorella ohadii]|uniref:Protein kinase domain-containing protein n=1 Tax=Chlorella ohadii TaxID=2649997 RepID=A0AAD5H637_9CHLO|nr:hypothetical protein COHA_003894 [Chlorella ohadii]
MLRRALLALALCAALAAAGPHDCSPQRVAKGWTTIATDVEAALDNTTSSIVTAYAAMIKGLPDQYNCKSEGPSVSWTGCASSTDPNRFVLHVNVTCPDWTKRNVTVTLRADVLKSSTGALSVIDVDDEAVFVDGQYVGTDVENILDSEVNAAIAAADKPKLENLASVAAKVDKIDDDLDDKFDDLDDKFDDIGNQVADLGEGVEGTVKLMRERAGGRLVAVKYVRRGASIDENVENEILNHMRLSGHPHIVQFYEAFLTTTHLGISMEAAFGGCLFDLVSVSIRLKERHARLMFQQLIAALAWCHSQGIHHRDVKLENLLLSRPAREQACLLKLCDFGFSKDAVAQAQPHTMVGTPAYVAPEVLASTQGCYPFQDARDPDDPQLIIQHILHGSFDFPPDVPLSPECKDLIQRILVRNPAQRITLQQIQQHPWFLEDLPPDCQAYGPAQQAAMQAAVQACRPWQTAAEVKVLLEAARQRPGTGSSGMLGSEFSSDEQLSNLPGGGGEGEPATIPEESEGSEQMEEDQAALGKAAVHKPAADKPAAAS